MEFTAPITIEELICLAGLMLLAWWLLKTSMGRNALADSVPRRNNMPIYVPFIPLFVWFGPVQLAASITKKLIGDLQSWQSDFLDNLILCITGLTTIAVIIFLARAHFARRLRGFGLNIKTIHKDFFAAFVNLLTVWPLMMVAITLTMFFGELIWGREYQMQQHQQLKLITEYSQLPLRILIAAAAVVVAPLLEELLFRGLFQTMIRSYIEACGFGLRRTRCTPQQERARPACSAAASTSTSASSAEPQDEAAGEAKQRGGAWLAIAISSGLFTAIHANAGHWPALFVLGVCLGYAYEKSGSLFRPIFIHSLFNAVSIIAALNQ